MSPSGYYAWQTRPPSAREQRAFGGPDAHLPSRGGSLLRQSAYDEGTAAGCRAVIGKRLKQPGMFCSGIPSTDRTVQVAASYLISKKHEWSQPGQEIDCAIAIEALLAVTGRWRSLRGELVKLLRWTRDFQVWDRATRTAKEAQNESSKAAFIALQLMTIVWEVVRAELPLLLQNIAVLQQTETDAQNQSIPNATPLNRVTRALNDLDEIVRSNILERRMLLSKIEGVPPQLIQTELTTWTGRAHTLDEVKSLIEALSRQPENRSRVIRILNEVGKQCLDNGWTELI